MTYATNTNPLAVVLDLGSRYSPPTNPAGLDFDLADQDSAVGPVYRKPPLAISYRYRSEQTSRTASSYGGHWHEQGRILNRQAEGARSDQGQPLILHDRQQSWTPVPVKDALGDQYSGLAGAPLWTAPDAPGWEQKETMDDPEARGAQAWSVKAPRDKNWPQGFNWPPEHDVASGHRASDSILNWQPPPPSQVASEQGESLNLILGPYAPPGSTAVDFEMVPESQLQAIVPPTRSVDARPDLPAWSLKQALDGRTIHPWDRKPRLGTEVQFTTNAEPDAPAGEPPAEPEIKRTYIIMNASSLVALPTETPLQFNDLSIELDADSFAWSMTATILNRSSMDAIRPTAEGPAEVIATINGHAWRFLIERYSLDRSFAKETYRVTGVSRAQLLAAPYAPKRTGRIEAPTTATQAMTEQLQYTGFTISRQTGLTDYLIPAGAWGWDNKTAMEVITELAAAQGAIVVPDKDLDVLHIRHRYKQAGPWKYPGLPLASIDAVIADAQTLSYASQWEPQPEYNAVFVSGVTAGVACSVLIYGTAGDKPAPDIFDDLNVDQYQCRERGLSAIAGSGNQEIVTIDTVLPTSGAPGLIEPGMLAEMRDTTEPANTWRGNVLSASIKVGKPGTGKVTQTVKIERHHY